MKSRIRPAVITLNPPLHPARRAVPMLALGLLAAAVSSAWAQTAPAEAGAGPAPAVVNPPATTPKKEPVTLESITITATKRPEAAQSVPVSVFAVSGKTLEEVGITGVDRLDQIAAGVTVSTSGPGELNITLRGISNLGGGLLSGPSTGYYLDEAPLSAFSQLMPQIAFWDAERVEVLRGPQGTLFGEGSMGGTIRLITNKPDATELTGRAQLGWSTVSGGGNGYVARAMVNAPIITDELALRVTASREELPGWVDVPDLGLEDANDGTQTDARVALRWTPTRQFTLDATYTHQKLDANNQPGATSPGIYKPSDLDPVMQPVARLSPRNSDFDLANLTASYDFGFATLLGTASWFKQNRSLLADFTPITTKFFGPAGAGGTATQTSDVGVDTQTQEIRLVSNGDQTFNWTIGGYRKRDERTQANSGFTISLPLLGIVDDQSLANVRANAKAWALFGDVEYKLTETVAVQAGVRRFESDNDQLIRFQTTSAIFGTVAGVEQPSSAKATATSPKLGLSWKPSNEVMLYARASEGFRNGGSNFTAPGYPEIPVGYGPEEVRAYELGVKSQPLRWLTVNAAVYRNEWTDLHLNFVTSDGLYSYIQNAGKAVSTGGEIEVAARPLSGLLLGLNLGFVDATIDEDVFNAFNTPIATKGNRIPFSPRFQSAVTAAYEFPLTDSLGGTVSGAYSYRGSTYSTADGSELLKNESSNNLYLRFGIRGDAWSANLFVNNVTNDKATVLKNQFAGATVAYGNYVQPRTVGVELNASF